MPTLDFMVLAEYVRMDAGMMHIMGAGVDTIHALTVPTGKPFGVAIRFKVDHEDTPGKQHQFKLIFAGDDKILATVGGHFTIPSRPDDLPVHWKVGLATSLSMLLPFPDYGDYSLTLTLDEEEVHTSDLRVVPRRVDPAS